MTIDDKVRTQISFEEVPGLELNKKIKLFDFGIGATAKDYILEYKNNVYARRESEGRYTLLEK